jgi:SAM-dependent methyltransferase
MDVGMSGAQATARSAIATHEARVAPLAVRTSSEQRDFGIEIGAFKTPIPGIKPYYFDRFPEYDYEPVKADYVSDAERLPIHGDSLDYVANANVFEHLANPVAALWEWTRIVRHGGLIYLVIPDRRHTFDRLRPLTAPAHMMEDFERGTTDSDGTHVADYIDGVDWSVWGTYATLEERLVKREQLRVAYAAAVAAGQPINIHFHTFELSSFIELIGLMNRHPRRPAVIELVDASEFFPASHPSGFLVLLRVQKNLASRLRGTLRSLGARGNFASVLTAAAKPFPKTIKPTTTE